MKKTKRPKKAGKAAPLYRRPKILGLVLFIIFTAALLVKFVIHKEAEVLPSPPENATYKQSGAPIDDRVADLLSRMTLDEKIGQMALVDKNSIKNIDDTGKYTLGGVLSGGGVKPSNNTPEGWVDMVSGFQTAGSKSRLKIPVLYGIDANHGHSNIPGATVFPHFIGLGATNDTELIKRVSRATAEELDATNINWSYSPSLDAPKDIRWGRVYEAFSDDPVLTAKFGQAYIAGLQENKDPADPNLFILATAKHYLGTGAMNWGQSDHNSFKIDQGKTTASEQALNKEYLPPFAAASKSEVSSVMVGLQKWGGGSVITNQYLLTEKLKNEAGFKGFIVSDWYGMYERAGNGYKATVKAVNAGLDMAMLPYDYKAFVKDVNKAVKRGEIKEERIDDAVSRILRQKFRAGLFEKQIRTADTGSLLGTAGHRAIAREAVAKSSVLLKNDGNTLPLSKTSGTILVAGSGANNVGRQSGAWTVEWQGIDGNWLPGSTSILQGIRDHFNGSSQVRYSMDGDFPASTRAAVGIAVVSEKPYAEGWGDNANPSIDKEDLDAIARLQKVSEKVVVVIISGRPLLLNNEQDKWDALVASWLPGSEGSGVADVLFGKEPFTGKLPITWPASTAQLPVSADGTTSDNTKPAYPRGYGLSSL